MMQRPDFDSYHPGPWPYDVADGVGLALSGVPNNAEAFILLLQGFSCAPVATRRILDALQAGQTKFTTVRSHLWFNRIGDDLARLGVTMRIVPPVAVPSSQAVDVAAWGILNGHTVDVQRFSVEEQAQLQAVLEQTRQSLSRIAQPEDTYGPALSLS